MKYSKQRELVLKAVCEQPVHPTAEYVYNKIKKDLPTISLATVYRNLNLLAEMGTIQRVNTGSGTDRFDGNPAPHHHMLCINCSSVVDINATVDMCVDKEHMLQNGYSVTGFRATFEGLCPTCAKSAKETDGN